MGQEAAAQSHLVFKAVRRVCTGNSSTDGKPGLVYIFLDAGLSSDKKNGLSFVF